MLITDAIRESVNPHVIYFLLTAYVEAVRYCDTLRLLPDAVRELPINGVEDVSARVERLRASLESLEGMNHEVRLVVVEALGILTVAQQRLESLRAEEPEQFLEAA